MRDVLLHYRTDRPGPVFEQPFVPLEEAYIKQFYRHVEPKTGRRYRLDNLAAPGRGTRGHPQYELMGVTRYWRYNEDRMQELVAQGRVIQSAPGRVPAYKRYLDESRGVAIGDDWGDIAPVQGRAKQRTGYLTQIPIALIERIIRASSKPGDVVLDPFAGCATACVAAQKLERNWIGIDIQPLAVELCQQRLRDELQLFDETRALTEAPERTDPRQLVLLPRGQALGLELWQQMQSEQEKTEAENAECLGCVIVWEHLEELGERQALAVCSAWCLMSVCNLVSPALWQVYHIIPFVFLNNDDSLRLGGAGRTADRQGRRQGLIDLSLAPLGFLGVPSVARLFVLNSDLNRLAIGWISKVKRQLLRGGHILVRMY